MFQINNILNARLLTETVFHKLTLLSRSQIRWWQLLNGVYRVCGLLAAILFSTRVEEAPLKIIDGILKKEARRRSNQHFLFLPFRYRVNRRISIYVWACLNFFFFLWSLFYSKVLIVKCDMVATHLTWFCYCRIFPFVVLWMAKIALHSLKRGLKWYSTSCIHLWCIQLT